MTSVLQSRGVDDHALARLFTEARTHTAWHDVEVPDGVLTTIIDLMKLGPTSANCSPARIVFVRSAEGKSRLRPLLSAGNVEKTMDAPVTAIIGYDLTFYERLPELFPHTDARSWFVGKPDHIRETAFRNGTLQGAYLIMAARALGLDCGPMSGFDAAGVTREFFSGTEVVANFLCNLGYGKPEALRPRSPRLALEDLAEIV